MHITSHFNNIFINQCSQSVLGTVRIHFRTNLQIINNEMMILIYLICRCIMLHQFISSRKFKICVVYLRMLFRMKAAYIFYFQYSFLEIHIINMHVIIHGSVIIHMCCKAVWWIIKAIQFNWLLQQFNQACIELKIVSPTFPVKCDVIYWKTHARIKGYIKQVLVQIKN